jgi:hypothetical protein
MRPSELAAVAATVVFAAGPTAGQVTTLTQAGYTGLGVTPNARLIEWGRAEATYDSQLPGFVRDPAGHNYVLGFGLLPNLEIAGRLAASTLQGDCFAESCGIRDLSASGKLGIGLDTGHRFRIAAGVSDFGGAATNFRTTYGVLTYDEGPIEISGGVAKRAATRPSISKSPLNGPFAAVAW